MKILLDHQQKGALLREAALMPPVNAEVWNKFYTQADGLAPDETIKSYLIFDRDGTFNPEAVPVFIAQLKNTARFANLSSSPMISENPPAAPKDGGDRGPKPGDLVQWESAGVAQFAEPRAVTGLSPDGAYVFVQDSYTGLPIAEVTVVRQAGQKGDTTMSNAAPPVPPVPPAIVAPLAPPVAGVKTETFSLDRGEIIVRFPSTMTADDFENIKAWLPILERKFSKTVQPTNE